MAQAFASRTSGSTGAICKSMPGLQRLRLTFLTWHLGHLAAGLLLWRGLACHVSRGRISSTFLFLQKGGCYPDTVIPFRRSQN